MKKRLLQIADYLGMSVRGFETACELQRGNISNMSENGAIGSDKLSKIIDKFPDINLEWLLTGNGQMLKSNVQKTLTPASDASSENIDSQDKYNDNSQKNKIFNPNLNINDLIKAMESMTEIMKANADIAKLNAENEKLRLENEKLNAVANERNSRSMENLISSLLAEGKGTEQKEKIKREPFREFTTVNVE